MPKVSIEKAAKFILLFIGLILFIVFFLLNHVSGDLPDILWRFSLNRMHLRNEFSMPYITPAKCGGFLLAADAQDLLFTVYMLMSFLIPNLLTMVKITNFLLSIVFAVGVYKWLVYFGIRNQLARMFTGLLVSVCGYWVFHLTTAGQLWAHGVAYMPWVMMVMEDLLQMRPQRTPQYLTRILGLIFLFFLLINSGYFWLQIAPMIIAGRFFALLLSWPRIGAVYEFQLLKFPRLGDHINHMQVIGDTVYLFKTIFRSFFDASYITVPHGGAMLGPGFFEITNFIGPASIIAVVIGLTSLGRLMKSKLFVGLLFASFVQICLTRSTHAGDLLRMIAPVYKQITHYWRGSAILVFVMSVLVGIGYEKLLNASRKGLNIFAVILMLVTLGEIFTTYRYRFNLTTNPPLAALFKEENPPSKPMTEHCAPCNLSNIFGYGHLVPTHLLIDLSKSFYYSPVPGYYNVLDVRKLFGSSGNNAFYFTHDWPLWPKADSAEFERYINYHQVIEIPRGLRLMNYLSALTWVAYFVVCIFVLLAFSKSMTLWKPNIKTFLARKKT